MHWVTKVEYVKDYLLSVTFNNAETKVVNIKPYVGGNSVFKPIENRGLA